MSGDLIELHVNGDRVLVSPGVTVAAALLNAGRTAFRVSVGREPRAPLCGMGVCYECRVTIDGVDHRRACMQLVENGMRVDTTRDDAR